MIFLMLQNSLDPKRYLRMPQQNLINISRHTHSLNKAHVNGIFRPCLIWQKVLNYFHNLMPKSSGIILHRV